MTDVLGLEPSVFHVLDRRLREGLTAEELALLGSLLERLRRNVAPSATVEEAP